MAQSAHIAVIKIVGIHHEISAALGAGCRLQYLALEEPYQRPGTCQAQYRFHFTHLAVLQVKLIAFDNGGDTAAIGMCEQITVNIGKYGRMNIGLPGQKPVGGKRQHSLGGGDTFQFLVEFDKPLTAQAGFTLQQLQARAQLDHLDCGMNLFSF